MKKIMFKDKFGLTQAVLEGRKLMTRRIIKAPRTMGGKDVYGFSVVKHPHTGVPIEVMALDADLAQINNILPKYKVGEVVAVAEAYQDIFSPLDWVNRKLYQDTKGWNNKMFVSADLMPHQIRITNVRVERLQDISDEDCIREGIVKALGLYGCEGVCERGDQLYFNTPRTAFAALIDKVSGKGTWQSNPWMFVYEFELIK